MSKSRKLLALACALALCGFGVERIVAAPKEKPDHAEPAKRLGIGREATPQEIAGWDIDIRPDGQGLPPGKGTVKQGEQLYMTHCAACHGHDGQGGVGVPLSLPAFLSTVSDDYLRKSIQLGRPGRVMPTWRAASNTTCMTPASCSSAPAREKAPRGPPPARPPHAAPGRILHSR